MKDWILAIIYSFLLINGICVFGGIANRTHAPKHCSGPKTNGHYLVPGYSLGCWLASPVEGK